MVWISTTPTEEELKRVPVIGTHWINRKVEKKIADGKCSFHVTR